MSKRKPLEVTSRLVSGDYDSFKAANNRSLMGVSYISNKRKPKVYQARQYNQVVVEELIRYAHAKLQEKLGANALKYLKLHTSLKIDWDSAGRIDKITDLKISAYSPAGELDFGDVVFTTKPEKIVVDFFYSKVDAASPVVESNLKELEQNMGKDNFQLNSHDFFTDDGKRKAQFLKVTRVPAVVIGGKAPLENPTKNQIFDHVNEMLTPTIETTKADFMKEPSWPVVVDAMLKVD
jgi:hypothetical protein